jgi:exopolysaccharide production protein ExoZ
MDPKVKSLYGLQILRGIAAVSVLIHHLLEESNQLVSISDAFTRFAAVGVDIFFVLSGFLMLYTTASSFSNAGAWSAFIQRRVVRIVPLYWLCTLAIVLAHLTGRFYLHQIVTPTSTLRSLLFSEYAHPVVYVGWTLNYEMYFYGVFALCLFAINSVRLAIPFIGCIMLLNIAFLSHWFPTDAGRFFANPIAIEFLMGMAVAAFYGTFRFSKYSRILIALVAVVCIYLASALLISTGTGGLETNIRWLAWGVPAVLLILAVLPMARPTSRIGRWLLFLGDISYSLYLTHAIVMSTFAAILKRGHFQGSAVWMLISFVFLFSLVLAAFVHRYIDRPLHTCLDNKLMMKRRKGYIENGRAFRWPTPSEGGPVGNGD